MKILAIASLLIFWTNIIVAQKVRLEGNNDRYLCLNDSIAETFEMKLKEAKIDSTITILYDFDNGRLSNSRSIIIGPHNGISNVRIIEGCDKIIRDTTYTCNLTSLWQYIGVTHFDDIAIPINSGTGQSHDKFYHITVTTPSKFFIVVVRDNQRKKSEKYKSPESDTRVMLTNKIEAIIK
jgi:hypothetical protein